jgi:hypothetical protein
METRAARDGGGTWSYVFTNPVPRKLTPPQRDRLVQMMLRIQGDPSRQWNPQWGFGIEHAAVAGLLKDADVSRYLDQIFCPSIFIPDGTTLDRGEVVPFFVVPGWRSGSSIPVKIRAVSAREPFADRLAGSVMDGQVSFATESSMTHQGWLLLPDTTGAVTLDLELEAETGANVLIAAKDEISPFDGVNHPIWSRLPNHVARKRVTTAIQLVESHTPIVGEDAGSITAQQVLNYVAGATVNCRSSGDISLVSGWAGFRHLPVDVAFDVYVRQGEREMRIGWIMALRSGIASNSFSAAIRDFSPDEDCDIELRSNPGKIERAREVSHLWKGKLTIEHVHVRKLAPLIQAR